MKINIGDQFTRLTVIEQRGKGMWECRCSCGNTTVVRGDHLRSGASGSCGCRLSELRSQASITHGLTGSPVYRVWQLMKDRCFRPNSTAFERYGGRGITVCDEWRDDFARFLADVGMPPQPGMELDRINNDGNYEPGNVRWATYKEQARNRRSSRLITAFGQTYTLAEWAERSSLNYGTLISRLNRGWQPEDAITEPLQVHWSRKRRAA